MGAQQLLQHGVDSLAKELMQGMREQLHEYLATRVASLFDDVDVRNRVAQLLVVKQMDVF